MQKELTAALRWLIHATGCDYGLPYGHFGIFNFWSGVGGSFVVNFVAFLCVWYVHHTCHDSWRCWRWGKYPAAGGVFLTCWKHHPDSDGSRRPRRDAIRRMHSEWQEHR